MVETNLQGGLSSGVGGRGLGQVQAEPQELQDRDGSSEPFPVMMPHISTSHRSQVVQLSSARELSEKVHAGVLFIVFPDKALCKKGVWLRNCLSLSLLSSPQVHLWMVPCDTIRKASKAHQETNGETLSLATVCVLSLHELELKHLNYTVEGFMGSFALTHCWLLEKTEFRCMELHK